MKSPGVSAWGYVGADGTLVSNLNVASVATLPIRVYDTFANAMPSAGYSAVANTTDDVAQTDTRTSNFTATGFRVVTRGSNGGAVVDRGFSFCSSMNAPAPKGGTGADAWSRTTSAGIPTGSYNIASCTETSAGVYEYTFEVPMPSSVYSTTATSRSNNARVCHTGSETTTGFLVRISDQSGNPVSAAHSVVVHATNASLPSPLTQDDLLFVDGRNASTGNQRFNVINANTSNSALTDANNNSVVSVAVPSGASFTDVVGVRTNVRASNGTNSAYSFYAAGDAPSFFQGYVFSKNALLCNANDAPEINPPNAKQVGLSVRTSGNFLSYLGSDTGAYHRTNRAANGEIHRFGNDSTAKLGAIQITAGVIDYFKASDYRLKDNVADLGSAVDQVKNLRPVSYEMKTDPGYTHVGFLAHEVQQVVPQAVLGDKDAVETVGTLTTAEGDVETNIPEPEAIPYGSTWEATGTRDATQMMSQENLIPILTKALQEVIAKNEDLEARLAALES